MAEESEESEKTEQATPRRLEKAREEGQIARSRELTTLILLGSALGFLWMAGAGLSKRLGMVWQQAFLFERNQAFDTKVMLVNVFQLSKHALIAMLPLLLILFVVALFSPMVLGGWVFSTKSLEPKPSKLNPLKGLKRMVSSQLVVEFLKATIKACMIGGVAVYFLIHNRGELLALMQESTIQSLIHAMQMLLTVCGLLVLVLIIIVLIDVPYQLWSHAKKLRMTKDEIKREFKESEGDPQLKGHIRSQQQAMARRRMMSQVEEADVIVTNPTHFAVALRYDEEKMNAPRVVAKGSGDVALKIKELGVEHHIPQLEAPPLARSLYRHVDLDAEIPGSLYSAVAEVLVWAMRLKRARADGGQLPDKPENLPVPESMDETDSTMEPEP